MGKNCSECGQPKEVIVAFKEESIKSKEKLKVGADSFLYLCLDCARLEELI